MIISKSLLKKSEKDIHIFTDTYKPFKKTVESQDIDT